jgi:hypothetical protein
MAVSKNTRRSVPDTNRVLQNFFQKSQFLEERERAWRDAMRHAVTGTPPLQFPIYQHLYFLNGYAQKTADLLTEMSSRLGLNRETSLYCQSLIRYVRVGANRELLESVAGIEHTDAWLFESQRKNLRDLDDVYFLARNREQERIQQVLSPRIRFLGDAAATR